MPPDETDNPANPCYAWIFQTTPFSACATAQTTHRSALSVFLPFSLLLVRRSLNRLCRSFVSSRRRFLPYSSGVITAHHPQLPLYQPVKPPPAPKCKAPSPKCQICTSQNLKTINSAKRKIQISKSKAGRSKKEQVRDKGCWQGVRSRFFPPDSECTPRPWA